MTIGPFTLTRGQLIPATTRWETESGPQLAGDGSVGGADDLYEDALYEVKVRLPRAEALNLAAYIRHGLRYWRETVTVIDGAGTSRLMRYWSKRVDLRQLGGELVEMTLPFREEVTG